MRYAAIIHREDRHTRAEFPDCPGCQTFAKGSNPIEPLAREALEGWLQTHLGIPDGKRRPSDIPPRPSTELRAPRGKRVLWVDLPTELVLKLELLWARSAAGLTQKQLAKRSRLSRRTIAKLEDPDSHPKLGDFDAAFEVLGHRLRVELVDASAGEHLTAVATRTRSRAVSR
jgi:hypothetical protein